MKPEEQLVELKKTLAKQIAWYEEHKEDEGYVYDEAWDQFSDLARGDYQRILWILTEGEHEHKS